MTNHTKFTVRLTDDLDALRRQTEPAEVTVTPSHLRKGDEIDNGKVRVVVGQPRIGTKYATVPVAAPDNPLPLGVRRRGPEATTDARFDLDTEITVTRRVPTAIAEEAWNVQYAVRQVKPAVAAHEKAVAKIASGSSSDLAWYAEDVMETEALANIWTDWANHERHGGHHRDAALAILADFVDYWTERILTWPLAFSTSNGHRMEDAAKLAATQQFVKDASWLVR